MFLSSGYLVKEMIYFENDYDYACGYYIKLYSFKGSKKIVFLKHCFKNRVVCCTGLYILIKIKNL